MLAIPDGRYDLLDLQREFWRLDSTEDAEGGEEADSDA
jgi:hypothetical protein